MPAGEKAGPQGKDGGHSWPAQPSFLVILLRRSCCFLRKPARRGHFVSSVSAQHHSRTPSYPGRCDHFPHLHPVCEARPIPHSSQVARKPPRRTSSDSRTMMQLSTVSARPCFAARSLATRPRCAASQRAGSRSTSVGASASTLLENRHPALLSSGSPGPFFNNLAARPTLCRRAGPVQPRAVAARDEREEADGSGVLSGEWAPTW